jgi:hypothetical protein
VLLEQLVLLQELERLEQRLVLVSRQVLLVQRPVQLLELVEQLQEQRFQRSHRCSWFGCSWCNRW